MAASQRAKDRFDAAVKVIHSLPKNGNIPGACASYKNWRNLQGPFQPSHEMMLTFYGYYKQATEGPCKKAKPSFWDVVNKAKWEAWHKLGQMPQEQAMISYVEELKKSIKIFTAKWNEMARNGDQRIVETMPQTESVTDFMSTIGAFYEVVEDESPLQTAVVPTNGPISGGGGSTGTSPSISSSEMSEQEKDDLDVSQHVENVLKRGLDQDEADAVPFSDESPIHVPLTNGILDEVPLVNGGDAHNEGPVTIDSESEEEFCDTSDQPVESVEEEIVQIRSTSRVSMSTPLKPVGRQNHVHFANTGMMEITPNGSMSPISSARLADYVSVPAGFPFMKGNPEGPLSDSMLVQGPTGNSFNVTVNSDSQPSSGSSELTDFSTNMSVFVEPPSMRGVQSEGGEETAPPGAAGQVPSQGPTQSQGATGGQRAGATGQSRSGRRVLLTSGAGGGGGGEDQSQGPAGNINEQITLALIRLQQDMNSVLDRLNRLEARTSNGGKDNEKKVSHWLWPFPNLTRRAVFFVLVWPIIVHVILNFIYRRRRKR